MLLCHIAGINNLIKKDFIDFCNKYNDLTVYDIDILSIEIMNNKEYIDLLNQYYDDKSIGRRTELLHKLSSIWKDILNKKLQKLIEDNKNKKLILIGLTNFFLDQRVRIDLPTKNLFFVDIDPKENAKQIIEYNLDKFRKQLIDGIFPFDHINIHILEEQRVSLTQTYLLRNYKMKNIDAIKHWIMMKITNDNCENVYYASNQRYEDFIPSSVKLIGYNSRELAMLSTIPKSEAKRLVYYKDDKLNLMLKINNSDALEKLKKPIYIYEFVPAKKVDEFRCLINGIDKKSTFEKRQYVSDMYDELIRNGVIVENNAL
uniref:Uncharacterized protein n=1 Tax=viral metagenome TaxID=1070528 RepID=A0A6C0EC16_9ZZZZ